MQNKSIEVRFSNNKFQYNFENISKENISYLKFLLEGKKTSFLIYNGNNFIDYIHHKTIHDEPISFQFSKDEDFHFKEYNKNDKIFLESFYESIDHSFFDLNTFSLSINNFEKRDSKLPILHNKENLIAYYGQLPNCSDEIDYCFTFPRLYDRKSISNLIYLPFANDFGLSRIIEDECLDPNSLYIKLSKHSFI